MPLGPGPRFKSGTALKARSLNELQRRTTGVLSSSSGGFNRVGGGGGTSYAPPTFPNSYPFIVARITGSESIGDNRWKYSWSEMTVNGTDFVDRSTPRTGSMADGFALNGVESNNASTGVQGNGVNLDGQIFTDNENLELQPAATGAVVLIYVIPAKNASRVAYVFFYENAIDGECGSGE